MIMNICFQQSYITYAQIYQYVSFEKNMFEHIKQFSPATFY